MHIKVILIQITDIISGTVHFSYASIAVDCVVSSDYPVGFPTTRQCLRFLVIVITV